MRAYHKTAAFTLFILEIPHLYLFSWKETYFSVDIAVILILLTNISPFFFFVIFFYLNYTAMNVFPQYAISPHRPNSKMSILWFRALRAIDLHCSIQKRQFKGFIKYQHKEWRTNLTSCAYPSYLNMKGQERKISEGTAFVC